MIRELERQKRAIEDAARHIESQIRIIEDHKRKELDQIGNEIRRLESLIRTYGIRKRNLEKSYGARLEKLKRDKDAYNRHKIGLEDKIRILGAKRRALER